MTFRPEDLELLAAAPLRTGTYWAWQPHHGVPVRTTIGEPKNWTGPPLERCRSITPYGLFHLEGEAFTVPYLQRLDRRSGAVVSELAAIARRHPGQPLVLLCFERDRADCHRGDFARWAKERFGLVVDELTP